MKKVAIFSISLRTGGAEKIISYLLNMENNMIEMHLILLEKVIDFQLPKTDNIKIFELGNSLGSRYLRVLNIPFLAKRLKKYLIENNIDVVLSFLNRPNLISCMAKKKGWSGKLIISERVDTKSYYDSVRLGFGMIILVKLYYRYADEIIVISKGIARSLSKLGISKCKVVYNPIKLSQGNIVNSPLNRPFTFISIGRLEPQKNHALLIRAFSEIKNQECKLVIIGVGRLVKKLMALTTDLNLEDRVRFMGHQNDVKSWLSESDCMVFTSDYEGFGNVILEALDSGVPVISTDCPYGPREILSPKSDPFSMITNHNELAPYGILTPRKNVTHLVKSMQEIIDNEGLRTKYQHLGPSRAADFDIKNISKQYLDVFL